MFSYQKYFSKNKKSKIMFILYCNIEMNLSILKLSIEFMVTYYTKVYLHQKRHDNFKKIIRTYVNKFTYLIWNHPTVNLYRNNRQL
jgi:hypothetical protein